MNLTSLTGKIIYDESGNEAGYTLSPVFGDRMKKLKGFVCADTTEEEFFLPFSGGIIPPVRRKSKVMRTPYSPLLRHAYSVGGKYLGIVKELTLQDDVPQFLWVNTERYPVENVACWGDCILLKPEKRQSPFQKRGKKREPFDLLGRKILADVRREDGSILFQCGETVTKKTLALAETENKLVELTAKTISPAQSE